MADASRCSRTHDQRSRKTHTGCLITRFDHRVRAGLAGEAVVSAVIAAADTLAAAAALAAAALAGTAGTAGVAPRLAACAGDGACKRVVLRHAQPILVVQVGGERDGGVGGGGEDSEEAALVDSIVELVRDAV